ncbi:UNVERIFIED_CONTAM: putative pumilio21 [Sesamum calycinum]|uniref:Pumilio21 n=1 Tax=Sesamum calycinum TaxID=2727403 RepID=A0AAW2J0X9_9LAMI
MDSSTSPTPLHPTHHDDNEVILYVGRPQLGKYGTFRQLSPTANSQSNDDGDASLSDDDSDTFSVFSFKTQEDREKDVSDQNLMDRQQRSNHLVHHFRRRPLPVPFPYADQRFRLMMLHKFRYPMKYGPRIPIRPPIQGGRAPFLQARPLDVNHLEEIMEGDDREQKETLVSILLHYNIFMLLLNKRLHCIYCMLVDACEGQQLDLLVSKFNRQTHQKGEEVVASCHGYDKSSVQQIRGYNDSSYGQDVILQCLLHFPTQPNEVLYEKAILHFQDLATHEVGCRSLNECIAVIGGDQRVRLLNQIADVSDFLSYDPYGNYVVQNVLGLKDGDITSKITDCLENEFIRLAVRKEGSLVVEKCMEASNNGIIRVAAEIERGFSSFYDAIVRRLEPRRRALRRTGGKNVLSIMEADQ